VSTAGGDVLCEVDHVASLNNAAHDDQLWEPSAPDSDREMDPDKQRQCLYIERHMRNLLITLAAWHFLVVLFKKYRNRKS
jgi:hypothetical protein